MSTKRTLTVLLDTNVWLDYYLPDRIGNREAYQLIDSLINSNAQIAYSPLSTKDVYYLIMKALKSAVRQSGNELDDPQSLSIREYAWGCIDNMTQNAVSLPIDERVVWMARKSKGIVPDYEDGLVVGAGELADVDYLVTSDKRLLSNPQIKALSVEAMNDYLVKVKL